MYTHCGAPLFWHAGRNAWATGFFGCSRFREGACTFTYVPHETLSMPVLDLEIVGEGTFRVGAGRSV